MRFTLLLSVTFLFAHHFGRSQGIVIGETKAEYVKTLIKYQVESYYSANGTHSTKMDWDAKYKNGEIYDVIICYEDQYLIDFRLTANYCKHYLMENGILSRIVTQYENISIEKLIELIEVQYGKNKVDGKYFTEDYKHFYEVYLAENSQATAVYKKAENDQMPSYVQESIKKEQLEAEKKRQKAAEIEAERLAHEKEIKSKIYDLQEYDESAFDIAVLNQKARIIDALQDFSKDAESTYSSDQPLKNFIPSYKALEVDNRIFIFRSGYTAYYKLKENSTEGKDYGYVTVAGSRSIKNLSKINLEYGDDKECILFNRSRITISPIRIEGYEVMTSATINNIDVAYIKGITTVKIRNGAVVYKKNPPAAEFEKALSNKLSKEMNGLYKVKYEAGNVMGSSFVNTTLQKKKSVARKILVTTAIAAAVLLYLVI